MARSIKQAATEHKKQILLIVTGIVSSIIFQLSLPAQKLLAADRQITAFYEQGQRDTDDQYEESDLDYFYSKKYIRFDDQLTDQISGSLAYRTVDKTYDQRPSSSNYYNQFQTFWEYLNKWAGASLKIDLDGEYKDQVFNQSTADDKRSRAELGLAYTRDDDYYGRLRLGITRNDHPENTDQSDTRIKGKIEAGKYLFADALRLDAAWQREDIRQDIGGGKSQNQGKLGLTWKAKMNFLDTFRLVYGRGQRSSQDDEDDDLYVDYNYNEWNLASEHEILPKLTAVLKYQNEERNYLVDTQYNSRGWTAEADLKYEPIFGKHYYKLDLGYRNRDYTVDPTRANKKLYVIAKAVYSFEPGWRLELEAGGDFYRYPDNASDSRNVWKVKPSVAKELMDGLTATITYEWRFKDYLANNDVYQNVVRVGVEAGW